MMKTFFIVLLCFAFSSVGNCQGIVWNSLLWDSVPPLGRKMDFFIGGENTSAILHKNGGVLTVGLSEYLAYRSVQSVLRKGIVVTRISSSGDSLGLHFLPGRSEGLRPMFIRNNPFDSIYLAILPRDTVLSYNPVNRPPSLLVKLDTAGRLLDTIPLPIQNPNFFNIQDASFLSPNRILLLGGSEYYTTGIRRSFELIMLNWPSGTVRWRQSVFTHPYANENAQLEVLGPNRIYIVGAAGTRLVAQKIDTNGIQTGGYTVAQQTLNRPAGGIVKLLANGKVAYILSWGEEVINGVQYYSTTRLAVKDTASVTNNWSVDIVAPLGSYRGFGNIIGANDDGSILVTRTMDGRYWNVERYSATGQLEATWPLTYGDYDIGSINTCVYAGNNKAYLVGKAVIRGLRGEAWRYWSAYLDGTGNPYTPTATAGPRAAMGWRGVHLHPNPTTDFLTVDVEQSLRFEVLSSTGAVVLAGLTNTQAPIAVGSLSKGLYMLHLTDGKRREVKRFVKE